MVLERSCKTSSDSCTSLSSVDSGIIENCCSTSTSTSTSSNNNNAAPYCLLRSNSNNSCYDDFPFNINNEDIFQSTQPWIRVVDKTGDRLLWLLVELRNFRPQDISVTLNKTNKTVTIAASNFRLAKQCWISRSFRRQVSLPENFHVDASKTLEIKSCVNRDGVVVVVSLTAPPAINSKKPMMTANNKPRKSSAIIGRSAWCINAFRDGYGCLPSDAPLLPVSCKVIA